MKKPSSDVINVLNRDMAERVKELDCTYAISHIAANPALSLDDMLQQIADLIPLGFRDSAATCVRITIGGKTITSVNFQPSGRKLEIELKAKGDIAGKLEVGYIDPPPDENDPFLAEEKRLVDAIAARIEMAIQSRMLKDALARSEKSYRNLVDNALVGILQSTLDGRLLYANHTCLRMFGYDTLAEAIPVPAATRYRNPKDRRAIVSALKRSGKVANFETECLTRSGQSLFVLLSGTLEGEVITAMMMDITSQKQTEKMLQNAYETIKSLKDQLEIENICLRDEIPHKDRTGEIIGASDPMKYAMHRVRQVARTKTTVIITGETGTGKNVFARFLHRESDRRNKPFVNINCASLPANLIESELFGREKGAFTGSSARQMGRFELAHGGTIFLDEIGELPIELQVKLLRVLEDGEFEYLGSPRSVKVDVRVIASTNRNLEKEVKNGRFRKDLFYRLNAFPVTIPPLRHRKEDIPLLVTHYMGIFSQRFGKRIGSVPKNIMKELVAYDWPGNVRELINVVERAVILSSGPDLRLAEQLGVAEIAIEPNGAPITADATRQKRLVEVERDHICETLQTTGWRIEGPKGAARLLGINPSTLRSRMRKLGIRRP